MPAVLLYCIIVYSVSKFGLPSCFEQREILIVVTFCPFLLCPIALLARIAMSGFFSTELLLERCSLDICKDWGDRPFTRLLPPPTQPPKPPPHTHTHTLMYTHRHKRTHEHRAYIRTADSHIDILAIFETAQPDQQCTVGVSTGGAVRCGAALCAVTPLNVWLP